MIMSFIGSELALNFIYRLTLIGLLSALYRDFLLSNDLTIGLHNYILSGLIILFIIGLI